MLDTVIERAVAVLGAAGEKPAVPEPTRRYVHSRDRKRGVRVWATTTPRTRTDLVGLQFYGEGVGEGERLETALERLGFFAHSRQPRQLTFAKSVAFSPDGQIDRAAVSQVRKEIDSVLDQRHPVGALATGFRAFMLASPLAEIDLPDPQRPAAWRGDAV
jgi:hypothetical protein